MGYLDFQMTVNKESEVIQNVHASNKYRKSAGKLLCA